MNKTSLEKIIKTTEDFIDTIECTETHCQKYLSQQYTTTLNYDNLQPCEEQKTECPDNNNITLFIKNNNKYDNELYKSILYYKMFGLGINNTKLPIYIFYLMYYSSSFDDFDIAPLLENSNANISSFQKIISDTFPSLYTFKINYTRYIFVEPRVTKHLTVSDVIETLYSDNILGKKNDDINDILMNYYTNIEENDFHNTAYNTYKNFIVQLIHDDCRYTSKCYYNFYYWGEINSDVFMIDYMQFIKTPIVHIHIYAPHKPLGILNIGPIKSNLTIYNTKNDLLSNMITHNIKNISFLEDYQKQQLDKCFKNIEICLGYQDISYYANTTDLIYSYSI